MAAMNYSQLADVLKPYLAGWVRQVASGGSVASIGGGGGGSGMAAHELADTGGLGAYHTVTGLTAGQVLKATAADDARFAVLNHGELGGIGANDHHNRAHALSSASDHTGLLPWAWLNKTGSNLADLATRSHASLQGVLPDQHHSQVHDIVGTDHALTGAQYALVGATAVDTLGLLTPSADVSAGVTAILRSQAGALALLSLSVADDAVIVDELTVGSDILRVRPVNLAVGVNVNPDGAAALDIRAGATSDHSQRIKQIAGQTGRLWRIESTSGQELIVLDSVGNLQSGNPGFVSGQTGWQITPVGNAEFNNGTFRGRLRASVFQIGEVHVTPGTLMVSYSGGTLRADSTISDASDEALTNVRTTAFADQDYLDYRTDSGTGSGTGVTARSVENWLELEDPDTGHYPLFVAGDLLQIKAFSGSGIDSTWFRVNSRTDMTTHWRYHVQVMDAVYPTTVRKGMAVAAFGRAGMGAVKMTGDDAYGPFLDVFTVGEQPWAGQIYPHVRLGRLDGVGVPGLSGIEQYGIVLGENLADATKPYLYASNRGVRQYKIDSQWHDGANLTAWIESSGRVRFGTNVESGAGTFLDINPALGLATFKGVIEVVAGSSGYANLTDKPTLGTLAAQNNLDGVPDGSTYARVNSTIIGGGFIRVGSGAKDSTLNGWFVDAGEIVGQAGGVDQVVLNTSGQIRAGGAGLPLTIDAGGITMEAGAAWEVARAYALSGPYRFGGLGGWYDAGTVGVDLAVDGATGGRAATARIIVNTDTTDDALIDLEAFSGGADSGGYFFLRAGATDPTFEITLLKNNVYRSPISVGFGEALLAARTTAW